MTLIAKGQQIFIYKKMPKINGINAINVKKCHIEKMPQTNGHKKHDNKMSFNIFVTKT